MVKNEGTADRWVRGIAGALFIIAAFAVLHGLWQGVVLIIGAILAITALTGSCLIYKVFGISTAKK